ncbi:MAG: AAA domain-containing protein [Leptospiraceae bacterium]|nr:AAA domain-containing protein [Leptospiraceae bacterium]
MSRFSSEEKYQEYLLNTLKLESEANRKEFLEKRKNRNFQERRNLGLVLYPLQLKETEVFLEKTWKLTFQFFKKDSLEFHQGNNVLLFEKENPDETVSGTIRKLGDTELEIIIHEDELPDLLESDTLAMEKYYDESGFIELKAKIETVFQKKTGIYPFLKLFMGIKSGNYEIVNQLAKVLNDEKHELILVRGAPGTGKTSSIAQAIKEISSKEKILVLTESNSAIDVLTEKLILLGLKPIRFGNPARVDSRILDSTLDARLAIEPDFKNLKKYRKEVEEIYRKASKFKRNFNQEAKKERAELKKEARELSKLCNVIEKNILSNILDKTNILCGTITSFGKSRLFEQIEFDTVILDEATQSIEPNIFLLPKPKKRIILSGDENQLPPTILSSEAKELGLDKTLFENLTLLSNAPTIINLNVQYRIPSEQFEFSNKMFYNSKIEYKSESDLILEEKIGKGIIFIDTSGSDTAEELEGQSLFNDIEVSLVVKIVSEIPVGYSIGIISPYKAQVKKISEQVSKEKAITQTIDAFQGSEKDIIIISLVRSNEEGEIGFLKDYRRMNVALTRASKKLIVIGDSGTLSVDSFYKKFIEYVEQKGSYRTIWEFDP